MTLSNANVIHIQNLMALIFVNESIRLVVPVNIRIIVLNCLTIHTLQIDTSCYVEEKKNSNPVNGQFDKADN